MSSHERTTMSQKKIRIGVVFGGRSGEHEVSLASACAVIDNLDPNKYEIVPIGITKSGQWLLGCEPAKLIAAGQGVELDNQQNQHTSVVAITGDPTVRRLIPLQPDEQLGENDALDVIFPVMHGTYGEDGTMQGLLEMANIAYVGNGVLGAALGMDKEKMKMVFASANLPNVKYLVYRRSQWDRDPDAISAAIEEQIGYPNFVKPVNLGSSVGINKAHDREELRHAMNVAAEFDRKIIIEQGINCREFECAVLGNDEPIASVVGEVVAGNEFYDYDSKYAANSTSETIIPAHIPQEASELIRRYAIQAFQALDLNGLARIDFFIDKDSNQIYINEVNTMPGFTPISMYPKLWAASGIPYNELLDRLIELGIARYEDRQRNRTTFQ